MFATWFDLFKEQSHIKKIMSQYQDMIENARWMFEKMGKTLLEGGDPDRWGDELKERDKILNQSERDIRKLIVEHLAINPTRDLGSSLVFFSGVKDAERLGDYCKNLHEIAVLQHGKKFPEAYLKRIYNLFATVESQFDKTASAFADWDRKKAEEVMDRLRTVKKECADLINELIASDLPVHEGISMALTLRYLKRIASHISNICSGIVNPVHQIDYYRPNDSKK